jgi:hypothetical protein
MDRKRTEKDLWIEMSIREISTQAHFAILAYKNIDPKAMNGSDAVFSSIHSFLCHCTNISKMLKASDKNISKNRFARLFNNICISLGFADKAVVIGNIIDVDNKSIIHNRRFRNNLEHYDYRLKEWIRKTGVNVNIGTYNIGPKSMIQIPNMVFVTHYDPTDDIFTFVNKDFNLRILYEEAQRIKDIADSWIKKIQ